MTIGPDPIRRMLWRSLRLGMAVGGDDPSADYTGAAPSAPEWGGGREVGLAAA